MLESFNHTGRMKRAIVFGAGGGLGKAFTRLLVDAGWQVAALSRARPEGLPADVQWVRVDITDEADLRLAADQFAQSEPIDLVLIATGLLHDGELQPEKDWRQLDANHLARVFAVNAIGPALIIKHFAPLLPRHGKSGIAALSARVGSICDNRLGGWYAYRASKAALNQIIRTASIELARKRKEAFIIGLHPGTVETGLSELFQNTSHERSAPERSAQYLLDVIDRQDAGQSGKVFDWQGQEVPA